MSRSCRAARLLQRGLIAPLLVAAACARPSPEASYAAAVLAERAAKDETFRTAPSSPIPPEKRATLLPLAYFPPDREYIASASLALSGPDEPAVEMPTSAGQTRAMHRAGRLEFMLKGQSLTLAAFIEEGSPDTNRLFVPFTDLTTGAETYRAGRYLDLERTVTGIYMIDFNRAYQPYCYYNPTYDCPFPPPENRLKIAIRAGERTKGN